MITQRVFRTGAAVLFAAALATGAGKPPVGGAPPRPFVMVVAPQQYNSPCAPNGTSIMVICAMLSAGVGRGWQWHAIIGHNYT
jgi:hypothetical protein